MEALWGIDLGGTKIEGCVVRDGRAVRRPRVDTEQEHGYDHILGQVEKLVRQMEEEEGTARPRRIGLGHPGSVDARTGLHRNSNTVCHNGRPLVSDLGHRLGVEIVAANDANCFALAEAEFGAGKGAGTIFGVIMGTGVGGGLVVGGRVLNGKQGLAGEWGHNVLDPGGERCYCGKRGCVETILSGPALERFYAARAGERRTLKEIAARTQTDSAAAETVDRLVAKFGQAIAVVVNIFDPDVIVLGGGVSNVPDVVGRGRDAARPWIFAPEADLDLRLPELGDSAGSIGAALLVRKGW